jgi:hypothetical protein
MNEPRKPLAPIFIGVALTAVLLALLAYAANKRRVEINAIPQLTLISPHSNDTIKPPFAIDFTSTEPIHLHAMGWMSGPYHLHARLGEQELMPAAADIQEIGESTYRWTVPTAVSGSSLQLKLSWANQAHQPIPEGASDAITISIR